MVIQIICIFIVIFISFLYSFKEHFTEKKLYFNEVSMEDIQKIINKVPLLNNPNLNSNVYETIQLSEQKKQEIINKCNIYLESVIANDFKVLKSRIVEVREYNNEQLCNIIFIIHRENRYIGFELKADILIDNGIVRGINRIQILNSISEDILYLESGYDNMTHYDNAYSIKHTIMQTRDYEDKILKAQQDGLYQDRGLTKNILN